VMCRRSRSPPVRPCAVAGASGRAATDHIRAGREHPRAQAGTPGPGPVEALNSCRRAVGSRPMKPARRPLPLCSRRPDEEDDPALSFSMTGGPVWAASPACQRNQWPSWVHVRVHLAFYLGCSCLLCRFSRLGANLLNSISHARNIQN
jgi:hypothetical protein